MGNLQCCLRRPRDTAIKKNIHVATENELVLSPINVITTPRNDITFRKLNVEPKETDIFVDSNSISVIPNQILGAYTSCEDYLDVQFKLLREDFLRPLREAIKNANIIGTQGDQNRNTVVMHSIKIIKETSDAVRNKRTSRNFGSKRSEVRERMILLVPIKQNKLKVAEGSETFTTGSMLLLSRDNFKTVKFAEVISAGSDSEIKKYIGGSWHPVPVVFTNQEQNWILNDAVPYSMIESPVFYAPYKFTLQYLQVMQLNKFPMAKYFVDMNFRNYAPPHFAHSFETINFSVIMKDSKTCMKAKPLDLHNWPHASLVNLDDSQYEALKKSLTHELTIIQGPPGTGKTHTCIQIIKMLLTNQWLLQGAPILIVSYTNHSLDEVLERILEFVTDVLYSGSESKAKNTILRVGAMSQSEKVKSLTFKPGSDFNQSAKVVGMTTTGAAKYKNMVLNVFKPKIMIVEEAAHILEAHVVSALTEHCQQMIMIGDHKQLRPLTADTDLGENYKLNISLMERLIINGTAANVKNWVQLQHQHRMRPEIARMICPAIYEELVNHPIVFEHPSVIGCEKNLFFVDHRKYDKMDQGSCSYYNEHEARFVMDTLTYFINYRKYYKPSDITVIVAYLAQKNLIDKMLKHKPNLKDLRVSTIDGFQGEENNIIILSLVRSNPGKNVGFLATDNRVCVALSRARHGLFMIGNMQCLKSCSATWYKINEILMETESIGDNLPLQTQYNKRKAKKLANHRVKCEASGNFDTWQRPESSDMKKKLIQVNSQNICAPLNEKVSFSRFPFSETTQVPKPLPVKSLPYRFITLNVNSNLPCGHPRMYTPNEQFETNILCDPVCDVQVTNKFICGHEHRVPCYKISTFKCIVHVIKYLPCRHEQKAHCHQSADKIKCNVCNKNKYRKRAKI